MSALSNSFRQTGDRLRLALVELTKRIEESAFYERLLNEYEALELRQQKWIRASLVILVGLVAFGVFVLPILGVVSEKNRLSTTRHLIGEMRAYQDQAAVIHQAAPRPTGFQPLPAATAAEFEDSLKQFLGSVGLGGDDIEITPSNNGLKVEIPELSIRQATTILFQIDGWFPAVRNDRSKMKVNAANKDLLSMSMNLRFVGGSASGDEGPAMDEPSGDTPANGVSAGSGLPARTGGTTNYRSDGTAGGGNAYPGMTPPAPSDDFETELPPPSFEEDM